MLFAMKSHPFDMKGPAVTPWRTLLIAILLSAGLVVPCAAQDKVDVGFVARVHKGKEGDAKYVLFVPHDYKGDKDYPLILFLHGGGERGEDGELPVTQGIGNA